MTVHRRGARRGLGSRARVAGPRGRSHPELLAAADPGAAADAAWAASGTLHAAAAALGSRILRQAADAYDRAARAPYGRVPAPTPAGDSLRRAARLLAAYGFITSDPSFRPVVLITRLAALAEAVAGLRRRPRSTPPRRPARCAPPGAPTPRAPRGHAGRRGAPRGATATLADAGFPVPPARPRRAPRRGPTTAGAASLGHPDPGSSHDPREQRSEESIRWTRRRLPDLFGDALSHSAQRMAQLGSLLTSAATVRPAAPRGGPPPRPSAASGRFASSTIRNPPPVGWPAPGGQPHGIRGSWL